MHSPADRHLDYFHIWAIMDDAAKNIYTEAFCAQMFSLLLSIYIGVELLDHMTTLFSISSNCQTISQSSCTILHSYQQCMGCAFLSVFTSS